MSEIPDYLKYTESHEWVETVEANTVRVGITAHAQQLLGDLVFVELPEVGQHFEKGEDIAVVESVKAASDVYAPLSGKVLAVNEQLTDSPGEVNAHPYTDGWLFTLELDDEKQMAELLTPEHYQEIAEA